MKLAIDIGNTAISVGLFNDYDIIKNGVTYDVKTKRSLRGRGCQSQCRGFEISRRSILITDY